LPNEEIEPGQDVLSQDGHRLGAVQEVQGEWFKIDVPRAQDYWMHQGHVSHTADEGIVLDFDARLIDDVRFPRPGAKVVRTRDGHVLGRIRETVGHYFKVDAPRAQDYWLNVDFVASEDEGSITVDFDRDSLNDVKVTTTSGFSPGPGGEAPFHEPRR
jgi:hypothetical protein